VPVAAAVKVARTETVAAAAPQKSKLFLLEILKELRKITNDRGIPSRRRRGRNQGIQNAATDAFRRKDEMLSQDCEARRTQKSNFDPAHKRTILIAKN
jgi:hypothetical protein